MNEQGWMKLLRISATGGGLMAMYISASFSADGFSINNPDLYWMGWLLAFLIVIVEFVWRKPGMEDNLTIAVVGIAAYGFGIFTNVLGILEAQGITEGYMQDVPSLLLAILTGLFLEVMPEPFVSWGITGKSMADMFGETRKMLNGDSKVVPAYSKPIQGMGMSFHSNDAKPEFARPDQQRREEHERPVPEPMISNARVVDQHLRNNGGNKPQPGKTTFQGNKPPSPKRK